MFRGQFDHAIDDKGRLSIPAKLREALGKEKSLILTSLGTFITAFPLKTWRSIEDRIRAKPTFNPQMRDFLRTVYSSAEDVAIDPQGRILISQGMRQRTGIIREVVIIGAMDLIEIWDKERWAAKVAMTSSAEDLTAKLGELGV